MLLRKPSRLFLLVGTGLFIVFLFGYLIGPHAVVDLIIPERSDPDYNINGPPRATKLTASKLLSRPLSQDYTTIPKILHQSWKTEELPAKFSAWSLSCREKHPDWEWVLWTDKDNLKLVRKHYPWLERTYQALPGEIYRADMIRALYMYTFGGYVRTTLEHQPNAIAYLIRTGSILISILNACAPRTT